MKLLFIVDPLAGLKPYKDSTYADDARGAARGHATLRRWSSTSCCCAMARVTGFARKLDLVDDALHWYTLEAPAWRALTDFDAVLMRNDPPFDTDYMLRHLSAGARRGPGRARASTGRRPPRLQREAGDRKFPAVHAAHAGHRGRQALIRDFLAEHGDIIVKPLDAMGGSGDLPPDRRRPQPQRDPRNHDPAAAPHRHGAALPPGNCRRATSASC